MDAFLQNLLRRYASGDVDDALAHRIVNTLLRSECINRTERSASDYGFWDADHPKSIEDIADILTKPITPLKIVREWEDDHVACGEAIFLVDNKCYRLSLFYAGPEVIGCFNFTHESPQALKVAREAILHGIWTRLDPEGIAEEYEEELEQQPLSREEIIQRFNEGTFMEKEVFLHSGPYGLRWGPLGQMFQEQGQKRFEEVFGPVVRYQYTQQFGGQLPSQPEERFSGACGLSISPEQTQWYFRGKSAEAVGERLPLDASPFPGLVRPDNLSESEAGHWPFNRSGDYGW